MTNFKTKSAVWYIEIPDRVRASLDPKRPRTHPMKTDITTAFTGHSPQTTLNALFWKYARDHVGKNHDNTGD